MCLLITVVFVVKNPLLNTLITCNCFIFLASHVCPAGYFKCPGSYCIEDRFVCDQEHHCEWGEDERNCGEFGKINTKMHNVYLKPFIGVYCMFLYLFYFEQGRKNVLLSA